MIHAGAGGVGSFAIQYAKSLGAKVLTTASQEKTAYVKALGADLVIDYRKEDFLAICEREGLMDIVFDTIGGESYLKSILATKSGGAVPCIVHPPDSKTAAMADSRRIKTDFFLLRGDRSDLNLISDLVSQRIVKPTVSRVLFTCRGP